MITLVVKYAYCKNGRRFVETYPNLNEEQAARVESRYKNGLREGEFYSLEITEESED